MSRVSVAVFLVAVFCGCAGPRTEGDNATAAPGTNATTERSFASGGAVDMQLDRGTYAIGAAASDHIRVVLTGNAGNTSVDLTTDGTHAKLVVKDTPSNAFTATIEVPKATDLVIRLSAGDLVVADVTGNKDVQAIAGDVDIVVDDPNDYSSVDASVKAGDLRASPFGGSKSGLLQRFTWSGSGKYTLRASLGAGDLTLRK